MNRRRNAGETDDLEASNACMQHASLVFLNSRRTRGLETLRFVAYPNMLLNYKFKR